MNREVENFLASFGYSEATKETYRYVLALLVVEDWSAWNASDLLRFVQRPNWGNSMQYVALCACKKYIADMAGAHHPALRARVKRVRPKRGRSLDLDGIMKLLASFDPYTPIGARDLALASLAIDTGLRASELAQVELADVDLEHRTLQAIVKGGSWGFAVYSAHTAAFIGRWLSFRQPADGVGRLFVSLRDNKDRGKPLTKHGVKAIFRKWGRALGMKLSPHDARRTFGNVASLLGAPTTVTMAAGRWESEESFKRYQLEITARAIEPYLPVSNALKSQAES